MVSVVNGTFELPGPDPAMVLVGAADPSVVKHLDEALIAEAETVDIRSGVVWMEVKNARSFLNRLVDEMANGSARCPAASIKVAVAELDASPQEMVQKALLANDLEQLQAALEQDALINADLDYEVRYQPIVRLANRSVVGFEALIRARLDGEIVMADELIDRATRGGWLGDLDRLSRELAIRGVGPWLGAGLLFLNMMAPDGTFDLAAARQTIRQAEDIGLDADQLVLEATEQNRYANIDLAAAQLTKLRNAGVRIAVDDVGDGYNSLRVATSFKPDVLKLTGDLIRLLPSAEATAIIRAVVELAHQTGAWVVAEGVETEAQAKLLRTLEVDWGQGVLFGRPELRQAG